MNEPQINVDHFYHRPIYHVVGLLGEQSEISAISRDLASAGVDAGMGLAIRDGAIRFFHRWQVIVAGRS